MDALVSGDACALVTIDAIAAFGVILARGRGALVDVLCVEKGRNIRYKIGLSMQYTM